MAEADATALDAILREVSTGSEALGAMLTELAEKSGIIPETEPDKPEDHWQGMPEFEQNNSAGIVAHVHFENEQDLQAFEKIIGGNVPKNTMAVWFPYKEYENLKDNYKT
jgi:hypothetical protein